MLEENKFSFRALLHGKDAEWYFARGLDDITAAGSYEVRLFHNDMESFGITTGDCDKEHYVVAHLFVSESAATGRQQALRVVGQTLLLVICATNAVKAFTRTCEITPKGASWGSWVDLGAASTTDIQDGSITAQKLSSDIRPSVQSPLRSLFVTAGAEYNDTGVDKTKTAPWGETVIHKAGYYYLNGLGDITEEQMMAIYLNKDIVKMLDIGRIAQGNQMLRTMLPIKSVLVSDTISKRAFSGLFSFAQSAIEVFGVSMSVPLNTSSSEHTISCSTLHGTFFDCTMLRFVYPINVKNVTSISNNTFRGCHLLEELRLFALVTNLDLSDSSNITKDSIMYIVLNSNISSAKSIILHPGAYARLADDADIVAALEAQPLISLVSA